MERTVYFHPQFVEELTLLPPELRIRLYADLLTFSSPSMPGQNFERYHPADPDRRIRLITTRFQMIGIQPRFYLSSDTGLISEGRVYLYLTDREDNPSMIATTAERQASIRDTSVKPQKFEEFLAEAPEHERRAAYGMNAEIAQAAMYKHLLKDALEETREEVAGLLNISNPQMDRMIMRLDFYLETLNRTLKNKDGGKLSLTVSFQGNTVFEGERLKDLMK